MTRLFYFICTAFAATITVASASFAQGDENASAEAVARTYMAHYSAVEWDAMEVLLASNVVFSDPTAEGPELGPEGILEHGRDAMMATLREFGERYAPIELGFEWDEVFTSNNRVIFIGHVNALYPTQSDGQNFMWRSEQVSVITVRDGLVVRHQDYANYAAPEQSMVPITDLD